jgi:hypothetical protein
MRNKRRVLWVSCCVACLFVTLLKPDGGIIFVAPLILLTFPAGFLGDRALGVLYEQLGVHWASNIGIYWLVLFSCGYAQWFVLVPWIARRWDRLASR